MSRLLERMLSQAKDATLDQVREHLDSKRMPYGPHTGTSFLGVPQDQLQAFVDEPGNKHAYPFSWAFVKRLLELLLQVLPDKKPDPSQDAETTKKAK